MFKYLFDYLRFLYDCKFNSSKYVFEGKCKCCGVCCRNILFKMGDSYLMSETDFENVKSYNKFYNHFFISGKLDDGRLLFTCKSLGDDNKCKDYFFRSIPCRMYPKVKSSFFSNGGELFENCGFKPVIKNKFQEFLK